MNNRNVKKTISFLLLMVISLESILFAKQVDPYSGEVAGPVAEAKNNISEGVIVWENPYDTEPINPLTPVKRNEEYDKVDNYVIDLNTIETRIKYFSPTYNNIKNSAKSSYWMAYYARGGNDTLLYDYKYYTEEILDVMNLYKATMNNYITERNLLDKTDPDYKNKYDELTTKINTYKGMYSTVKITYNTTNTSINRTKAALGLNRALFNVNDVDNNTSVAFARRSVTKAISSVVLTYMQLSFYTDLLEKQMNLYYDMYLLKKKNYELGMATALEVSNSLDTYENAKKTYNSTKTSYKNVKEQVAINLGYKISDIDKLIFVEPEPDLDYLSSINFENDIKRTYTSNSAYNSLKISDKDKRLPQSTGEELLHKRQDYISGIITAEFENIYNDLLSKKLSYDSSLYLKEICDITTEANKRKFDNNLVSELEYKGLELQNTGNILQVKIAKYNLINAINAYYYATLGDITIS